MKGTRNNSPVWLESNYPGTEKNIEELHIPKEMFPFLSLLGSSLPKTEQSQVLTGQNKDQSKGKVDDVEHLVIPLLVHVCSRSCVVLLLRGSWNK